MTHRILVVDDEEPIVFAMSEYFTLKGYEVDTAREIEEAEALISQWHYDVVIADLRLTGTQGIEGLEILRYLADRFPATRTDKAVLPDTHFP